MLNKCNAFFSLISHKPKILYRKKESFSNKVSLSINILYIVTLTAVFITAIYHCYIKRIYSISSYYTPITTNLSMAIKMELVNRTTSEPITNSDSLIKITMIEFRLNSTEVYFANFSLNNRRTTSIHKPIGNENIVLYRDEDYYNTIGIKVELCLAETYCLSKPKQEEILSQSILRITFPSTHYNPMDDEIKSINRVLNLELSSNKKADSNDDDYEDYLFAIEPQMVYEDNFFTFTRKQYRRNSLYNNYIFTSFEKVKRATTFSLNGDARHADHHYLNLMLINSVNVILITKVNFICETLPSIIAMFYFIKVIFRTIFRSAMQKAYDSDFERYLIHKQEAIEKSHQKNYSKTFSLMYNNDSAQNNNKVTTLVNGTINNSSDNVNLNNSRGNMISVDDKGNPLRTFDKERERQLCLKKHSSKTIKASTNQIDNSINPQTVIRFKPNMQYTFQENIPVKNKSSNNSNSFEGSQQQIPNDNNPSCLFQPISLNINFNNNSSSNKMINFPQKEITKTKTFFYKACCCYKVHVNLKDISQILRVRTEIMKYASIDEIVSRLSFYEKFFPKIVELIESKRINEAINDSNFNINNNNNNLSIGL